MVLDQILKVDVGVICSQEEDTAGNHFVFRAIGLEFPEGQCEIPISKSNCDQIHAHLQPFSQLARVSRVDEDLAHLAI